MSHQCHSFSLLAVKLILPAIGDVDLKRYAPEDLLVVSLCSAIANLSLDDPLLPYDDLKLSLPNIDVDHLMDLPASEEAEVASFIDEVMDDFCAGFVHLSTTEDIVMDSACDLIDFDGDVSMPMEGIEVPIEPTLPHQCNDEDTFSPSEEDFMSAKKLDINPDPMAVDSPGSVSASWKASFFPPDFICRRRPSYYEVLSPDQQKLLLSVRNLNLEVPPELASQARPVKKVCRKATRARAGGRCDSKAAVGNGIGFQSVRESSFRFALFNPNEPLVIKERALLVRSSRTSVTLLMINQLFRGCHLPPSSSRRRTCRSSCACNPR